MRDNSVVIIRILDVHGECIVVRHRGDNLEQMEGVCTHNDLVWMTYVLFELVRMEDNIDQDGVCFVEIDNFESGFSIGYGRVRQDILDCGDHITDGLDLDGFYRHNIVGFVHFG